MVYWKAGVMTYEYHLVTLSTKGKLIDAQIIAGTKSNGSGIAQTVATISPELEVYIVGGVMSVAEDSYDPQTSESLILSIKEDGNIEADV